MCHRANINPLSVDRRAKSTPRAIVSIRWICESEISSSSCLIQAVCLRASTRRLPRICHRNKLTSTSELQRLIRTGFHLGGVSDCVVYMTSPTLPSLMNDEDSLMEEYPPSTAHQEDESPRDSASDSMHSTDSSVPSKKRSMENDADDGPPSKARSLSPAVSETGRCSPSRISVSLVPRVTVATAEEPSMRADSNESPQGDTHHAATKGTGTNASSGSGEPGRKPYSQTYLAVPAVRTHDTQRAKTTDP